MNLLSTRTLLIAVCAAPLVFSLPSIGDPFGQTEEAVNATIWGLGGRNILKHGLARAQYGADVSPYPGTGGGIYAHHPPLPVWVSALTQVFGTWEGLMRLVALAGMALALFFLFRSLSLFFQTTTALIGTAVASFSGFALGYGRMMTTLTLAAPLFMALLFNVLRRSHLGISWRWPFLVTIALCVLSSWDGVFGVAGIILYLLVVELPEAFHSERRWSALARALLPGFVGLVSLAAVAAYLIHANHGTREMLHQFAYRTGAMESYSHSEWLARQLKHIGAGIGWVSEALLVIAPVLWLALRRPRGPVVAMALSSIPALGMTLVFSQGAFFHEFWAFNLLWPVGFAVAMTLDWVSSRERIQPLIVGALVIQAIVAVRLAGDQLGEERKLNSMGAMARDQFKGFARVPMFSSYQFYPHVSWYTGAPVDVALSVAQLRERIDSHIWKGTDLMLVDQDFAADSRCSNYRVVNWSKGRRWVVTSVQFLADGCPVSTPSR